MDKDILWKQFSLYVDLYKFYMDITMKVNLFYYGITGAILSFLVIHVTTSSDLTNAHMSDLQT